MGLFKRTLTIIPIAILALVIAACDNPLDDSADDSIDIETPAATEPADDAESPPTATDDAVETDDLEPTPEPEPTATDVASDDAGATDDRDDAAETDADDAQEILDRAAERAAELSSAQFELDGSGYIEVDQIGEVSLSNAKGSVERPDRAQLTVDVDAAIADVPVEVLGIEGRVYFSDPVSGSWHTAPDDLQFNPAILFDDDDGLPALIRSVSDPEVLGTDTVDGREAHKIYGIISQETINAGTGGVFRAEGDVDFNVWIDVDTYDVLLVLAEDPTDETDSVWEMRIFDHDEPVEIDDPNGDDS